MMWFGYAAAFLLGGVIGACVVALDAAKYMIELPRARRAVEFARYMATCAESYMDEVNAKALADESVDDDGNTDAMTDAFCGLRSSIYEFRKRERKVANG